MSQEYNRVRRRSRGTLGESWVRQPITCPLCGTINTPTAERCDCGVTLSHISSADSEGQIGLGGFLYVVLLAAGLVQYWVMVTAVADWIGSTGLALVISVFSVGIPIPWFLVGHWYLEGTLPWIYLGAWVVGCGAMFSLAVRNR